MIPHPTETSQPSSSLQIVEARTSDTHEDRITISAQEFEDAVRGAIAKIDPYIWAQAYICAHELVMSAHITNICCQRRISLTGDTYRLIGKDLEHARRLLTPKTMTIFSFMTSAVNTSEILSKLTAHARTAAGSEKWTVSDAGIMYRDYVSGLRSPSAELKGVFDLDCAPSVLTDGSLRAANARIDSLLPTAESLVRDMTIPATGSQVIATLRSLIVRNDNAEKASLRRAVSAFEWADLMVRKTKRQKKGEKTVGYSLTNVGAAFREYTNEVRAQLLTESITIIP